MGQLGKTLPGVKVLVTGGGGFIGSHLVKKLLECGARVNVICRSEPLMWQNPTAIMEKEIEVDRIDLLDYDGLTTVIDKIKPAVVFHLAGLVNLERSFAVGEACIRSNIQGTLNLLQALRKTKLNHFVFTSTTEVYGNNRIPFTEEQPEDPPSPYAISKLAGEHLCRLFQKTDSYPVTIIRLSALYGPCQAEGKLIPYIIKSFLAKRGIHITSGRQKRDFVYVKDAVEGLIQALHVREAIGETINLGHPEALAVREVVSKISQLGGFAEAAVYSDLPMRPNEQMLCACLGEKAKRILDWEPQTTLERGLRETIAWYAAEDPPLGVGLRP